MRHCPECREELIEHAPFDPELLDAGLFENWRRVYTCPFCGHVETIDATTAAPARPDLRLITAEG